MDKAFFVMDGGLTLRIRLKPPETLFASKGFGVPFHGMDRGLRGKPANAATDDAFMQ